MPDSTAGLLWPSSVSPAISTSSTPSNWISADGALPAYWSTVLPWPSPTSFTPGVGRRAAVSVYAAAGRRTVSPRPAFHKAALTARESVPFTSIVAAHDAWPWNRSHSAVHAKIAFIVHLFRYDGCQPPILV